MATVLIFGPTGRVGSAIARSIHKYGVGKVFLAMRDPAKEIPGLSKTYERISADLTDSESIRSAAQKSGAKRAFIYATRSTDGMRATIEALASGGVEFVVFLSSSTISEAGGDVRQIPKEAFIPWGHAQIEINLEEVFGQNFVRIRPGYFASNSLRWKTMIQAGRVKLVYPTATLDWIAPDDIGHVAAAALARGPLEGTVIGLYGPQTLSQQDAVAAIGSAIGKHIDIEEVTEDEGPEMYVKEMGYPAESLARTLIQSLKNRIEGDSTVEGYHEAVSNIKKYTEKEPMTFEAWTREHTDEFRE
ncbi:NAD(P)-binding protein [Lophiostoma macrostomum CBS 122681]|uniref:NAD(P)-binding protein n=1 Tax=Lophiostoma macrostomum CBS 122681 TaxID=1314788 RepID=A0A6A6SUT1_9PLEO|nr:NAD(P)-binding protein [Lophiostoma macrostomum CBS 122681]